MVSERRIEFLDFAKGFAILTIVVYHYLWMSATGLLSKAIMLGGSGVHLFLIMSGFGLSLSVYSSSAATFYRRRFLKILLPYYMFVTFLCLLNCVHTFYPGSGLYAYLGHIIGYKMFDESIVNSFGGHFWFLSTIIQFYLVFPLIVGVRRRLDNDATFMAMAVAISVVYWLLISYFEVAEMRVFNSSFLQYFWEFCGGMILADLYKRKGYRFWKQKTVIVGLVAVVGIGLMGIIAVKGGRTGRVLNDIPAAFGYTALVVLVYSIGKNWISVVIGPLKYLGTISYELYLTHMFVALIFIRTVFSGSARDMSPLQATLVLPSAIAVAVLYRRLHLRIATELWRILPTARSAK